MTDPAVSVNLIDSAILGAIQGATEFLPVSSSAHLIVFSNFLSGKTIPLSLNVALHMGTVVAVLIYFWRDWLRLLTCILPQNPEAPHRSHSQKLLMNLIIGSIPAGVLGIMFKDDIERIFHHPIMTVIPLALVGFLMWIVDKKAPINRTTDGLNFSQVLIIGLAQASALIPGTSRSGATIIGGRLAGLSRLEATRFSFLLGTPAMLGAALLDYKNILAALAQSEFWVGVIMAAIVGLSAIHLLLEIVKRWSFLGFAIYRFALALWIYFVAVT
jgi:undecaprenyl-diphosphatase